jgi:pimeloyl-ACP methyl ester carboxylesterase
MNVERSRQSIDLRDGRKLSFAEWGQADGKPLLMISGSNSGRLTKIQDELLQEFGIRLITLDRAGLGLSTYQPNRRLLDFPDDIAQLMDSLKIEKFSVLAASQGGPYGAVCAYKLAPRLYSTSLISAVCPMTPEIIKLQNPQIKPMLFLAKKAPFILQGFYAVLGLMMKRSSPSAMSSLLSNLPETDQAVIKNNPQMFAEMHADTLNSLEGGAKGAVQDMQVVLSDWGFRLEDIKSKVFLWQGENDPNVVPAMGRYYAERLPNCEATFVPNAGHLLFISHMRPILEQLLKAMN